MRGLWILALTGAAVAGPTRLVAQQSSLDTARVRFGLTGRMWLGIPGSPDLQRLDKLILLRGVLDGLVLGRSRLVEQDSIAFHDSDTYGEVVRALDQFYSDYRNEPIFLVWALQIITMERRGVDAAIVESHLREMRRRIDEFRRN